MSDSTAEVLIKRIKMAHGWILEAAEKLTEDELCQRFGPTAPPIGWHLWHITRWADRVQAYTSQPDSDTNDPPNPNQGIWEKEQLAQKWGLDPARLGTLEEGSGMDFEDAAALPRRIGREALLAYARQTFAATDEALARLRLEQFLQARPSVMEYTYDRSTGNIWRTTGADTIVVADIAFHMSHANRHLGMIEALSGLLERKGTVTV